MPNKVPEVGAVRKALDILCLFDARCPVLSLAEISRRLGIPKSTAHNLLRTLQAYDFLQQDDADRRYRLGPRLFELSSLFAQHTPLLAAARPHLERLAARTQETVKLGVLSEAQVLILAAIESPYQLHTRGDEGRRAPLHCTGLGKAILSALNPTLVRKIVARRGLPRLTARTITRLEALEQELREIRARGYALDLEENEPGVVCVAAPIAGRSDRAAASVSVSAPAVRVTPERLKRMAGWVVAATRAIARDLAGGSRNHRRVRKDGL